MNTTKQIICPKCSTKHLLHHPNTQTFGCSTCLSILQIEGSKINILGNNLRFNPPKSFIKIGQFVTIDSTEYVVIGRTIWSSDYKEYWKDDEGEGYSDEKWSYHEWLLSDTKGDIKYLFEDDEGYHFSENIKPKFHNLPTTRIEEKWIIKDREMIEIGNFYLNSTEKVLEIGHSTLGHIEGEVPWEANLNEKVFFATYQDNGKRYTIETEPNESDPKKGSYFEEWSVSKRYLMECFRQNPEIGSKLQEGEAKQREYTFWAAIMGGFTAICFILFLMADTSNGNLIKQQTFSVPAAKDTTAERVEPILIGKMNEIRLTEGPVRIVLSASLPKNTDLWAGVEIHDNKDLPINAIDDQFYDEEGTEFWQEDGESGYEHYEERNVQKSELYRVEESGTFSAEVHVAPQSLQTTQVTLSIYDGVKSGGWFMGLGFAGLFVTVIVILVGYSSMPWRK
ncbi:MAG: DUF4178 domain-containing protein [Spirosomaceae bacterium]|nr:DUF4178 domain-containing protein [Spirosomataceae bacterium]